MRYEEFLNSEYNRVGEALANIVEHVIILLWLLFLVIAPVLLTISHGGEGFMFSIFIILITLPLTIYLFKSYESETFKDLPESFRILTINTKIIGTVLTFCSCILFIRIGFQTMIPTLWLIFIYTGIPLITYFILKWRNRKKNPGFVSACLMPFYFSLLLLINYIFSFNPMKEDYAFIKTYETVHSKFSGSATQITGRIVLENNAYDDFFGIRVFTDYKTIERTYYIHYTFKRGIFGIRVMTSYYFQ